jgi:lipoprotein-anchoring transpeptidase ErfK/SrfK
VCFFHTTGVSFHGTYWHDNFGAPMSQGCVNMRIADARWLFRW